MRAETFLQLGKVLLDQKLFAEAERCYRAAARVSADDGSATVRATACWQLGYIAQGRWQLAEAESWFSKALALYEASGDNEAQVLVTLHKLGLVALHRGDYQAAEARLRRALSTELRQGLACDAAHDYHRLAAVAHRRGDFTRARYYYGRALAIFDELDTPLLAIYTLLELGLLHRDMGRTDGAVTWLAQAWSVARVHDVDEPLVNILAALSSLYRTLGPTALRAAWPAGHGEVPIDAIHVFRRRLQ